jgi:hypothetical protein
MPSNRASGSLPAGRSTRPLDDNQVRAITNTILGYERNVAFEYDEKGRTRFAVEIDADGAEYGKIYFAADAYPGPSVADPNAALSMQAAMAHEVSHYHRWNDRTELPLDQFTDLDEALTSLDAALRSGDRLGPHDAMNLVRDAMARLQRHRADLEQRGLIND